MEESPPVSDFCLKSENTGRFLGARAQPVGTTGRCEALTWPSGDSDTMRVTAQRALLLNKEGTVPTSMYVKIIDLKCFSISCVVETSALSREKDAKVMLSHILDDDSDRSQGQVFLAQKPWSFQ